MPEQLCKKKLRRGVHPPPPQLDAGYFKTFLATYVSIKHVSKFSYISQALLPFLASNLMTFCDFILNLRMLNCLPGYLVTQAFAKSGIFQKLTYLPNQQYLVVSGILIRLVFNRKL